MTMQKKRFSGAIFEQLRISSLSPYLANHSAALQHMLRFVGQRVLLAVFPFHEYGKCSGSWYYERRCLPLIKDLLQSGNLIQSSAVLCSTLNASRNLTADRPPCMSPSWGAAFYISSDRCYSVQELKFPQLIRKTNNMFYGFMM